jgi:hypothetical protein
MAVIESNLTTLTGIKILTQVIEDQSEHGIRLMPADRTSAAYLWSKGVADQYPMRTYGINHPNAGFESLSGSIMRMIA